MYHYPNNSDNTVAEFTGENANLFACYVKEFLKIKQTASGFPPDCTDREKYVSDYFENEGIQLDPEEIEYNNGQRSCAKLFLCALFGKFGQ